MRHLLLFLLLTTAVARLDAQSRTLPQQVREQNGPINRVTGAHIPSEVTLKDLLRSADVIVRATVGPRPASYLSPDARDVLTDHVLENVQVLFPRDAGMLARPGPLPLYVVTQKGGTITLEGHQVRSVHRDLAPLQPGTDAIFMLSRNGQKYNIARGYLGVFAVEAGTVTPVARGERLLSTYRGQSVSEFVAAIKADWLELRP